VWCSLKELDQKVGEMSAYCHGLEQDVTELQQTNQVEAHFMSYFIDNQLTTDRSIVTNINLAKYVGDPVVRKL